MSDRICSVPFLLLYLPCSSSLFARMQVCAPNKLFSHSTSLQQLQKKTRFDTRSQLYSETSCYRHYKSIKYITSPAAFPDAIFSPLYPRNDIPIALSISSGRETGPVGCRVDNFRPVLVGRGLCSECSACRVVLAHLRFVSEESLIVWPKLRSD